MGNFNAFIINFESTGLSPNMSDRTLVVGTVLVHDNLIVDRFQSLMNPCMKISPFIEHYTGISNKMLTMVPPINEVMKNLAMFIQNHHLVAHNASFDSKFIDAEFSRINNKRTNEFEHEVVDAPMSQL